MNSEEAKKLTYNLNGIELKGVIAPKIKAGERMAALERLWEYFDRYCPGLMEEIIEERDRELQKNPDPFACGNKLHS